MIDKIKSFLSKFSVGTMTSVVMALSLFGTSALAFSSEDVAILKAILGSSLTTSQSAQLDALVTPVVVSAGYNFTKDLSVGSKGADVTALQNLLGIKPATGYFGAITKSALIKYQLSKQITPASGYFGPKTRAIVNASVSSTPAVVATSTTPAVTSTELTVSLAPTSPSSSALIAGQSSADLVEYVFSNKTASPVIVTNVTLQRMGVSADTTLSNVYLYNGATRLTDSASVSSGKITFNSNSGIFTVPTGASMTISVRADIDSNAGGQLIAISLSSIGASAPISSVYPISGSSMSVFTSTDVAKATSTIVNGLGSTISAGTLNQVIWATDLSLSGRAVYLKGLTLKVIGSIPTNALENFKLYSSGIQVASSQGIDANGMVVFNLSSAPYKIDSTRKLEVRADIVGGSSRTFSVSVQNASDIQLIDSNYSVGISVANAVSSTGTFTISSGSVSTSLDSSLSSRDVVSGASNVVLAKYSLKAYGEEVKISDLFISSTAKLDNVNMYINGMQVGSTRTISATGTPVSFGVNTSILAGQTATVEVKGDIKSGGTNLQSGDTIKITLSGSENNTSGKNSYTYSKTPSVSVEGPTMSVVNANLTVAKSNAVLNSSISLNQSSRIGSYVIQTNSSEGVRISNLVVTLGGTISATTSLSNLYVVVDGVSSTPTNPQTLNNIGVNISIPKSSSKIVDIYVNTSNATGTVNTSLVINGYGMDSDIIINSPITTGQTMQVGSGTIANPTIKNTSPDSQFVVGPAVSKIMDLNFVSTGGISTISEMYFDVSGPITSISVSGVSSIVVSGSSTINSLNLSIPTGYGGKNISVLATYSKVGFNAENSLQSASVKLVGFKYSSGNDITTVTASSTSDTMVVVGSKPTVNLSDPAKTSVYGGGTVILARVTVIADVEGDVSLIDLPIRISTTVGSSVKDAGTPNQVKIGNTPVTTTGGISLVGTSSEATGTISFGSEGYTVQAGTSVTFDIYGTATLVDHNSIQLSMPSADLFVWKDIEGNATTTGSLIYNFPSNSATVSY